MTQDRPDQQGMMIVEAAVPGLLEDRDVLDGSRVSGLEKPAVEEVSVDSGCHSSHRPNEVMHANRSRPGAEHAGV
jgi:hypothetical protein